MIALTALVSLLGAFELASASPVKSHYSIKQVATGHKHERSGLRSMASTYRKYGKEVPAQIAAALASQETGSVTNTPTHLDDQYLIPVTIGTPAQALNLDLDTGSSDLWVFSTELTKKKIGTHAVYNASASSTSKLLTGETWHISYGDGSGAKGNVYADTVVIGGLTVMSQAVEAATSISSEFVKDKKSDGLIGFGFDKLNTVSPTKAQTWFGNIVADLAEPVFAADLKHDAPGTYDFGFVDTTKYTGALTYVPVKTALGYWTFAADGYTVGNATAVEKAFNAIADTGTTLIYLPTAIVKAYYDQISGASTDDGYFVFPCTVSPPDFAVTIGGASHTVPGSYIKFQQLGDTCLGGIQSSASLGINILGDLFQKSLYVVYNIDVPKIGFAAQS